MKKYYGIEELRPKEKREGNHCVYIHKDPKDRLYIGITGQTPEARWKKGTGYFGQNNHFFEAVIRKYGWDNIKSKIVRSGISKPLAHEMEKFLIRVLRAQNQVYGFNISAGGDTGMLGRTHTPEARRKIAEAHAEAVMCVETEEIFQEPTTKVVGL